MSAGNIAAWTRERLKELLPGWLGRHAARLPGTIVLIAAPLILLALVGLGLNWTFGIVEGYRKGADILHGGAPDPATQQGQEEIRRQLDAARAENAAMQAKIDAILKAVSPPAGAAPLSPAEQAAKEGAVAGLVADPQPAAQGAARDLAAGDVAAGFDALEREARAAEVSAAEKWRRLGALAAGVDTARARAAYEQAFRLDPADFWTCVALARLRQQAGDLRAAGDAARAAEKAARTDRERYVANFWVGDVLVKAGDLAGARVHLEEGLTIAERLAAQNPGSAEAQRDVSVSLEKLGDVLVKAGDLAGARSRFEKSLELRERLAAQNPGSAEAQRDVSVSLEGLGDVLMQAGDLAGARARFEEDLAIAERLAAQNPGSAEAQRDVWVSTIKLGDVLVKAGDLAGARARFDQRLVIAERLAAQNPGSAEAQRDVWSVLWRLASLPDSRVTWQQVVAKMEAMQAKGTLAPPDVPFLQQARANAAAAAPRKASR
ncbi:MAG: hypothetical protein U1E33_01585 [Rhodospirillales bacterium]